LSREYFSINKEQLEAYQRQAEEERQRRKALMELRRKNAAELEKFRKRLEEAIEAYERRTPQTEVECIIGKFERDLGAQAKYNSSGGFLLGTLQRLPKTAYENIDKVRLHYAVDYPMGLAVPSDLQVLWQRYQSVMDKLEQETFIPAKARVAELINRQIAPMEEWQKGDFLFGTIESLATAGENHAKRQAEKTIRLIHSFEDRCRSLVSGIVDKVYELNRQAEAQAKEALSSGDTVKPLTIIGWQQELFNDTRRALKPSYALEALLRRVLALMGRADTQAAVDVFGALQQAVSDYEARAEEDFEMIQKGVAVAIIEHEFFAAINDIHLELEELESLAKKVTALWPMSQRIKTAFAHLDSFIKVLNPLQKRVYSNEENIKGEAIRLYLQRAFGARYARDHIILKYSEGFDEYSLRIAPAVLYSVLINLVDNALYWLGTISDERKLVFELNEGGITIANNGPKIDDEIKELIFTRGFSLKRGGRGLGLYIAKEVLRESGWRLDLCAPRDGCNVAFSIVKKSVQTT
jgi:signal transduction histidine kinase